MQKVIQFTPVGNPDGATFQIAVEIGIVQHFQVLQQQNPGSLKGRVVFNHFFQLGQAILIKFLRMTEVVVKSFFLHYQLAIDALKISSVSLSRISTTSSSSTLLKIWLLSKSSYAENVFSQSSSGFVLLVYFTFTETVSLVWAAKSP